MTDGRPLEGAASNLVRTISATETEISLLSTAPFRSTGNRVWIGGEIVIYASANGGYLHGCQRGMHREDGGTEPRPWPGGTQVSEILWSAVEIVDKPPIIGLDQIGRQFQIRNPGGEETFNVVVSDEGQAISVPLNAQDQAGLELWGYSRTIGVNHDITDVFVRPDGDFWVTRAYLWDVSLMSSAGKILNSYAWTGMQTPRAVAAAPSGDVYIAAYATPPIYRQSSAGTLISTFGAAEHGSNFPSGIAVDPATGNVYVTISTANKVVVYGPTGTYVNQFGTFGSGNGQFSGPAAIDIDRFGNVWVVDTDNDRITQWTTTGVWVGFFGETGTGGTQFTRPAGLAVDLDGNLYVGEAFGGLRKFSPTGQLLARIGRGYGSGPGEHKYITNVAVTPFNVVLAIDSTEDRVQFFAQIQAGTLAAYDQFDDFNGGGTTSGAIGENGWTLAGSGSFSIQASTAAHPGIVRLSTGTTSGTTPRITFGPFMPDNIVETEFIFMPIESGGTTHRVGLADGIVVPTAGMYVESTDGGTWRFVYWLANGTSTEINLLAPYFAGWWRLAIERQSSGVYNIRLTRQETGQTYSATTTEIKTSVALLLFCSVKNSTAAARTMDVDAARWSIDGVSRL